MYFCRKNVLYKKTYIKEYLRALPNNAKTFAIQCETNNVNQYCQRSFEITHLNFNIFKRLIFCIAQCLTEYYHTFSIMDVDFFSFCEDTSTFWIAEINCSVKELADDPQNTFTELHWNVEITNYNRLQKHICSYI